MTSIDQAPSTPPRVPRTPTRSRSSRKGLDSPFAPGYNRGKASDDWSSTDDADEGSPNSSPTVSKDSTRPRSLLWHHMRLLDLSHSPESDAIPNKCTLMPSPPVDDKPSTLLPSAQSFSSPNSRSRQSSRVPTTPKSQARTWKLESASRLDLFGNLDDSPVESSPMLQSDSDQFADAESDAEPRSVLQPAVSLTPRTPRSGSRRVLKSSTPSSLRRLQTTPQLSRVPLCGPPATPPRSPPRRVSPVTPDQNRQSSLPRSPAAHVLAMTAASGTPRSPSVKRVQGSPMPRSPGCHSLSTMA